MKNSRERLGMLFIHGIQGSPRQFDWMIEKLPEHVPTDNLLLPGHGKNVSAFRKSNMRQWQAYVDEAIVHMEKRCDAIVIVTHSMGGLLAIDACMHRRGSVKAMILLACPLKLHPTLRYIKIACKAALGRDLEDPYVAAAKAANSVTTNNPIAYLTCLRPYLHLLRKIISVRRKVHLLQVPIVAVHSSGDEIVSKKSLEYFYRLDNSETYIVSESGHFLYSNIAKDRILHSILTCLEKN